MKTFAVTLLFLAQNTSPIDGDKRHIILSNETRERLVEIYAADDRTDKWQKDLLGFEHLLPGGSVEVDVDDRNGNCRVDIKTVFDNGSSRIYRGVNACLVDGHVVPIR